MNKANQIGGLVIGTGDLSEVALGWSTYNGDHMSMYAVNVSVPKTLVRYLVDYVSSLYKGQVLETILQDVLDTPVSPELLPQEDDKIVQKTEDIVGLMNFMISLFIIWYVLVMNLVNFIKRQNLPSKINIIKIQLKNGYVYSTGVSLVNNLNVVVSPMVQKLDLSLYPHVVIGVCQVMPMFKYGLMK